ncbi:MAG: NUDIX hydrolase [Candidatus Micrarchaeota archaeon]|nr:NUDIX hydrolase [Candidatus Micrarchaeota archaeon]
MGKTLHKNRLFSVEEVKVNLRSRGKFTEYTVRQKDTVAVLPITGKNGVLLERQFRPAANRTLYEIPAGHVEGMEKPIDTARRELEEETGFKASGMRFLTYFYPSPGILTNREYLYVATGLKKGTQSLDKDEDITLAEVSMDAAIKLIKSGKIIDLKTIAAVLYYKRFVDKK